MSANTSTEIRTDNIIVTQTESNKQETIAIKQDAAEETFEYIFSCDQEVVNAPNSGTSVIYLPEVHSRTRKREHKGLLLEA